ncbi:MAG: pyrroloquinoline quinone-dependent dehydrogenase [Acidobacteria bacterium]|nr:pyrroloquinoline quinone-dependent dehydrogenase [Acidobacteriota bacterium]
MTSRRLLVIGAMVALMAVMLGADDQSPALGEWRYYSGDNGARKYSPLDQITRDNVGGLRIAWRRPHLDPSLTAGATTNLRLSNNFRSTPIMVNGVLYASNAVGLAEAFDPATGKTLWVQKPGADGLRGTSNRGVAYWGEGAEARIITFRNQHLYALDPQTGEPIPSFGTGGSVNLNEGLGPLSTGYLWNSAPLIARDVIVMGSAMVNQDSATKVEGDPGNVRAFDVRTGKLRWTFHVVPQEGDPALKTWKGDAWKYTGAGNVWALMSADDDLGYVYLPTTSMTNDMYGGQRLGDTLYATSVVCVEAATGKRVWHYQTVHHDLFDYDNPAAPILVDITVDGKAIKAVAQVTKQSFTYVLDRVTGKPVWPIEERPVPASTVPGEQASPTQPFPTRPPPFDRQGITENDLIDFTPELRAEALAIFRQYQSGPVFTPPSVVGDTTKGTIEMPGSVGGADWTGAAFDPDTGMLYVPSMTNPFVANLLPGTPKDTNLRFRASTRALLPGPQGLPLVKPPYGRITALNLNHGSQAWMTANGDGPRHHPAIRHLNLPPLGQSVRAAPLVTKTLLFVTEGDQINVRTPPNGGGNKIRAFDKATGQVVWEMALAAGSTGTLMTYLHQGKQYLVVAIGGLDHPAEFVALALP